MTEPPEPRRPEDDGGEEDYQAAWDNADAAEIMDGLEDDALLDSIAQGVRGDLGPDELTELLAGLRDEPDGEGLYTPHLDAVERGENVVPPRTSEERTTPSMLSESIGILNQVAASTEAAGPMNEAKSELETSVLSKLLQAVGKTADNANAAARALEGDSSANEVQGPGEHAAGAIEDAIEAVNMAIAAVAQAMEHEAVFRQVAGAAAQKHSGG